MRTQRIFTMFLCLLIPLSLLTSCSGYNSQMQHHLKNEANYHTYRGTFCDIYYLDKESKKVSLLSNDIIPECDIIIELRFDEFDTIKTFLGAEPNPDRSLNQYTFAFDITKENHKILAQKGFYNAIAANTPIVITTSSFIYMDSNYFLVSAVTYNETEYLRFKDGFQNIQDHIDEHKSLF